MIERRRWLGLAGILALGAVARLAAWPTVFTSNGVRFLEDTDPHYHVLRAERLLRDDPSAGAFDRNMDYPYGAPVLWPPLFDALLAVSARAQYGAAPSREELERTAAVVPVAFSLAAVPMVAALATAAVGGTAATLVAALLFALTPMSVEYGSVGRPDHHGLEAAVFLAIVLLFVRSARERSSRVWMVALGTAHAAAFWVWHGSALYTIFFGAVTGAAWLFWDDRAAVRRVIAAQSAGSGFGAVILASSIAAFGARGALSQVSLGGVTGFHVAVLAGASVVGVLLRAFAPVGDRPSRAVRLGLLATAAGVPILVVVAASPAARAAIGGGLAALTQADPWHAAIGELQPLFLGGRFGIREDLRFASLRVTALALAPIAAAPGFLRAWREHPERRPALLVTAVGSAMFLVLTCRSTRFRLYLGPFASVAGTLAMGDARARLGRFPRSAALVAAAVLCLGPALSRPRLGPASSEPVLRALRWLRQQDPGDTPRRAVMARWARGHEVQYYAGLPVVATPFGTDVGARGLRDYAAFAAASSPSALGEVLRRRFVRWILVEDALMDGFDATPYAPSGTPALYDLVPDPGTGKTRVAPNQAFWRTTMGALYYDGVRPPQAREGPALPFVRLVYETPAKSDPVKIFEVVEGARLRVPDLVPGERMVAVLRVTTADGRAFSWRTEARADEAGWAELTVPYATGTNGDVVAGPCLVRTATGFAAVTIPDDAVRRGSALVVPLSGGDGISDPARLTAPAAPSRRSPPRPRT